MKTKVKALQKFQHGRQETEAGAEYEFTKGDAADLAKAGLVQVVEPTGDQPADQPEEDFTSLVGAKMDTEVQNKMDEQPVNKTSTKKK